MCGWQYVKSRKAGFQELAQEDVRDWTLPWGDEHNKQALTQTHTLLLSQGMEQC